MGILQYLQISLAAVFISAIAFLWVDLNRVISQRDIAYVKVSNLNASIQLQNASMEAIRAKSAAAKEEAATALKTTQITTKVIYKKAADIQAATGVTCDDAKQLILDSVK